MEPRDLSSHIPYSAGRGIEEVARELGLDPENLVKLSSNENPFGPSPKAISAVKEAAETIHTYPKALHTDLTQAIADRWNIAPAQVWLGPGGDGVLDYFARTMLDNGDRVLIPKPGFAYYPMSARYHGGEVDSYEISQERDFAQTADAVLESYDDHRIIYINTPHNPTGSEMPLDEIQSVAENTAEKTLVVVDEAYGEFSENPSARKLLDGRDDICLLRTFSKAYGLAGLRLGYGIVPEKWASAYDRVNTPFAVNALACHAGLAALNDTDHVEESVETAHWARDYMYDNLAAKTWESGANFVLVEVDDGERVSNATQKRGVIVRDCSSFGLPGCIRISCGTRESTKTAVETVNEVLE